MFEISHADFMDKRSWIMDRRSNIQEFPRFADLAIHLLTGTNTGYLP